MWTNAFDELEFTEILITLSKIRPWLQHMKETQLRSENAFLSVC